MAGMTKSPLSQKERSLNPDFQNNIYTLDEQNIKMEEKDFKK